MSEEKVLPFSFFAEIVAAVPAGCITTKEMVLDYISKKMDHTFETVFVQTETVDYPYWRVVTLRGNLPAADMQMQKSKLETEGLTVVTDSRNAQKVQLFIKHLYDLDKIDFNSLFFRWLKERQNNLGFTFKELADGIGKNKKTVSLYMNGESPIKKDVQKEITLYIRNLEEYNGYKWLPLLKFGDLLLEMLSELNLNQQWLAKKIGKRQTDISNYVNGKVPSTAQTQYEILMYLYKDSRFKYGIPEKSSSAFHKLQFLLYGSEGESGMDSELIEEADYFDETESISPLTDYFDSLPEKVQSEIIKHYNAFFEQTEEQIENGVTVMLASYTERVDMMYKFRNMPDDESLKMVYEMEQEAVMTYPCMDDAEEKSYFSAVSDMRTLVTDDEYHTVLKAYNGTSAITKHGQNSDKFEKLIYRHGIMPDAVDELKMKLGFSSYDWYVWSLFLIAKHNEITKEEFDDDVFL
ncbi:hypothetical protein [Ruminococcus sp.]|uniref:hypothetical protein n=1 Tax=Ruminococcus sp. TaxID=41978 RepID=UPI0025880BB0|nr:hypothetical protein [Ruminococcus sp.]MCR5021804.1 helix-turn-helix domain-containing protein [Ruminococcus sp.]